MNKQQIKYYMNQPCVVIREITDEFSEIKINPQYTDAIDGSQWCIECMVGNNGTPTTHVCHQYDEVIEAINDTSAAIIVVVENRLLHNEPIEFKAYNYFLEKTKSEGDKLKQLRDSVRANEEVKKLLMNEITTLMLENQKMAQNLKKISLDWAAVYRDLQKMEAKLRSTKTQIKLEHVTVHMTRKELEDLIRSKHELNMLESGGVDNWPWYDESVDEEELDRLVNEEIESFKVTL